MKKTLKQDILMYLSLVFFCIITIPKLVNHVPWLDESMAWFLTREMTFSNVIQTLSGQGHFMVWFLLLMPFAKCNFCFPYSMFVVNWICYFAAMLVMWKKAPFHPIAKVIITFSWLSLNYFPIVARCHSVEILGLFLVMSMYKNQLKRPILYSLLLVFTAHTHFYAAITVIPLASIFLYNLIKNRHNFSANILISISYIFAIGVVLWLYPILYGSLGYDGLLLKKEIFISDIIKFYKGTNYQVLFYYIIASLTIFIFTNNKIRLFMLTINAIFYIFHAVLYVAYNHNMVFLYVYLILAYWLADEIHIKPKINTFFLIFFACLSFYSSYALGYAINNANKSDLIEYLNKEKDINKIYTFDYLYEIEPFLYPRFKFKSLSLADYKYVSNNFVSPQKPNAFIITTEKINNLSVPFKYGSIYDAKTWYVTKIKL